MELVLRAAVVYVALFLVMRAAGNRQFAEMTAFDAALIIVMAEVTGNALSGEDYSVTASIIVIVVLVGLDILLSFAKRYVRPLEPILDGVPTLLINKGEIIDEHLKKERVDEPDILSAARSAHGLEALDQVKYAVLEPSGEISIVPWPDEEKDRQERIASRHKAEKVAKRAGK